jgi:hypothetical protein
MSYDILKEEFKFIHKLSNYYFVKTHWVRHVYASTLNQISFTQSACIVNIDKLTSVEVK